MITKPKLLYIIGPNFCVNSLARESLEKLSKKYDILKNLKKRKNFNQKLLKKFKLIQLPISYKKKKSHFIVKNDFTKKSVNDGIKDILKKLNK